MSFGSFISRDFFSPRILLPTSLVFLFFFRPGEAFFISGTLDSGCYLQWLYTFLGHTAHSCPSYSTHPPGAALLWIPGALLATLVSLLSGMSHYFALSTSMGLSTFLLWSFCLAFTYQIWPKLFPQDRAFPWGLIWLLATPSLYYFTARTTWSHSAGLFASLGAVYFLLRKKYGWAYAFGVLLALTRPSHGFIFLLLATASPPRWRVLNGFTLLLWGAISILLGFVMGYNGYPLHTVIASPSYGEWALTLWGRDWGVLFLSPWWMAVLLGGALSFRALSPPSKAAGIWMFSHLFICVVWRGNGSNFGYRYLIECFPPALILWSQLREMKTFWNPLGKVLLSLSSLCLLWCTWVFRMSPNTTPVLLLESFPRLTPNFLPHAVQALGDTQIWSQGFTHCALYMATCGWVGFSCQAPPLMESQLFALRVAVGLCLMAIVFGVLRLRRREDQPLLRPDTGNGRSTIGATATLDSI